MYKTYCWITCKLYFCWTCNFIKSSKSFVTALLLFCWFNFGCIECVGTLFHLQCLRNWPEGALIWRGNQLVCLSVDVFSPSSISIPFMLCEALLTYKETLNFSIIMLMVQMVAWWVPFSLIFSHFRVLVCRPTQPNTGSKSMFTPPTWFHVITLLFL